ncbi:MAG: CDP-glycerol glycerophosphotransferase family protein [Desulfobacteraceae bacterium]|nr:CDP-glycerol glycerophosphotransferase family protein [Desulfobacteraceae bacterium]
MKPILNRRLKEAWWIAIRQAFTAAFTRIFGFLLTLLIRRDPGLTLVVHRPGTSFADNSKYFFVFAADLAVNKERFIMLTSEPSIQKRITDNGGRSVLHPTMVSAYLLLRCGKVVTDMDWFDFGTYPLTRGAKVIQLWHGAPLKHIELDLYRKRLSLTSRWMRPFIRIQKAVIGRYPVYDAVVATSDWFISKAFSRCFKAKKFVATGYPRNDILFGFPPEGTAACRLAWINVDKAALETVSACRSRGQKICLYVPTFRKELADPFQTVIDLSKLSAFAQQKDLLIVLKLHPYMHGHSRISRYPNLLEYAPLCDVYPLMPLCDLLITDYSSIFFDFLLFNRPIVFFAYDLESYLNHDREMYFDYDDMTPGAKCYTYDELEIQLESIVRRGCEDGYAEMRSRICSYAHDHKDNKATQRLIVDCLRGL